VTNVVLSPNHFSLWVAESNGNVSILIGSSKIAVYVHAQYKFGQKQSRMSGATSADLNCNAFAMPFWLVIT